MLSNISVCSYLAHSALYPIWKLSPAGTLTHPLEDKQSECQELEEMLGARLLLEFWMSAKEFSWSCFVKSIL